MLLYGDVQGIMIQEWTCGKEVMLIMQCKQLYITHRAVECIFGKLLNNSPLFPVSYKFKLASYMAIMNHVCVVCGLVG